MRGNYQIDRRALLREWEPVFREDLELAPELPSGLRWKVSRGKAKAGARAGTRYTDGYWKVACRGKFFPVAHIVLILSGVYPESHQTEADHIDRDKENNDVTNLRWADRFIQNNNRSEFDPVKRKRRVYAFTSPEGTVLYVDRVVEFCKCVGWCAGSVYLCISGKQNTYQGWTITRVK
jgi:hypothetical protein